MPRTRLIPAVFTDFHGIVYEPGSKMLESRSQNWDGTCASAAKGIYDLKSPIRGVSFVVPRDLNTMLGWASTESQRSDPHPKTFDFAAHVREFEFRVFESGSYHATFGDVEAGDSVTVAMNDENNFEYAVNGQVRYTSKSAPKFPLYLKLVAFAPGPCAQEVQWILSDAATEIEDSHIQRLALDAVMEEKVKLEILLAQEKSENKVLRQRLGLAHSA